MDLTVRTVREISEVRAGAWDALDHGCSPFLEHGFLASLEASGSIGQAAGWDPHYVLVEGKRADDASALLGGVACFVKDHSYGEYIFDWAWARASQRGGIPYYPKLVVAAPVTPATGCRILLAPGDDVDREAVTDALCRGVRKVADENRCMSIHWLFTTGDEQGSLERRGYSPRKSFQFHWHNRDYGSFDEFLATLTSRKRKQIRKERRKAAEAIDELVFVPGPELDDDDLAAMDRFYRRTTFMHGGQDYLRPGFFESLRERLGERMVFARVTAGGERVAGALYLETPQGLYGRYWGCDRELDCLHFETAYYAGIERCIEKGIPLFEAGAQGEHKLLRGFSPSPTYSAHWLRHPGLRRGVGEFLQEEARAIDSYMVELEELSPYKKGE